MDQAKFGQALATGKYTQTVKDENQVARRMNVPGTPAIMVDGVIVTGTGGGIPSAAEIAAAVEAASKK
jgi:protein-disulfide isomerase